MDIGTSYAYLITQNMEIWGQAVAMGILVVGAGALIGFLIHSTVAIFKMISNG